MKYDINQLDYDKNDNLKAKTTTGALIYFNFINFYEIIIKHDEHVEHARSHVVRY